MEPGDSALAVIRLGVDFEAWVPAYLRELGYRVLGPDADEDEADRSLHDDDELEDFLLHGDHPRG